MLTCRWTEFWSREFRSRCYFEWSINCDEIPFLTTTILRFRKRILVAATKELWIHAQNSLWIAKTICATKFTELKISKKNYKIQNVKNKVVKICFCNFLKLPYTFSRSINDKIVYLWFHWEYWKRILHRLAKSYHKFLSFVIEVFRQKQSYWICF